MSAARKAIVAVLPFLALVAPLRAQTWPAGPIRMVVPYAAGGATDAFARLIAGKLQDQMKTTVLVDDKAGAGGNLGTNFVAKSAPDGYTVLFNINGHAISPALYKSLPFDADADFLRVTQLVSTTSVLVVIPGLPVKTFQELIAYAKANPGKLTYGSTGIGNSLHLTMEMIKHATGIDIQMAPYRGDAPLISAMLGGEVQLAVLPMITAMAQIQSGALRPIGVSTIRRAGPLPDVPTIAEQGLPGFEIQGWMGLFVPARTPRAIVERLWRESKLALAAPDVGAVMKNLALEPVGSSPEEFDTRYFTDRALFERVVKDANIPLQD